MTSILDLPRWEHHRAVSWMAARPPVRGANYLPRTAINAVEMWQAETFDPATIDEELGWAAALGLNGLRIFLSFAVWEADPVGHAARLDRFLGLAARHGLGVMPILFDDCAFSGQEPRLGPQGDPRPDLHNGGWVGSPGRTLALDPGARPRLEAYVRDVVGRFGADGRVDIWDLYNEPGNNKEGEASLPLLRDAFAWARDARPDQPLTAGPWDHHPRAETLNAFMLAASDVISFHAYEGAEVTAGLVAGLAAQGRPLLCTEWLHRHNANTYATILPIFATHKVGWYQWGLVQGRTQTHLPWPSHKDRALPGVWQHDTLGPDGTPYDPAEVELLRGLAAADGRAG